MKKCCTCKTLKSPEDFHKSRSRKDGLQTTCKSCRQKIHKEHYAENKKKYKKDNTRYRKERREIIRNYLLEHPCVDCGESDPIVLEFDHLRDKEFSISEGTSFSETRILIEIEKCEVRCANCHRRKTAERLSHA